MSPTAAASFSYAVERELVGICKQSMWQVRQQLRQYIDDLHPGISKRNADMFVVMQRAFNECAFNEFYEVWLIIKLKKLCISKTIILIIG